MSGGFFRGTSADQDTRFSNKQAKLLKSQKFAPELEHLVDMTKVNMEVMKPWITKRVTELLGFEDEVLINFIHGLLDAKEVNGKEVQIQITGFMEKNTGKFMKELWTLLLSAQKNASGIPQQFLDAKEEEILKKKVEQDRIKSEIQRNKDKEGREIMEERLKKLDGGLDAKDDDTASGPTSKPKDSGHYVHDGKEIDKRNGVRAKNRVSRSPHSPAVYTSPHRGSSSRSMSKSFSNSRSYSGGRHRSRSISRSPAARGRSISPRRHSPWRSPHRRLSYSRRRSRSRSNDRSPSPVRRRMHSPFHRSSPFRRRRTPSPIKRRRTPSPSPIKRRRTPSSIKRRRSPSPVRRRRSPSPVRRRRSPTPVRRRRSPTPVRRRRSPSPIRRRRSPSPVQRRSTVMRHRSPSPVRRMPPSRVSRRSDSPVQSPSPIRRRYRSRTPQHRSPSPLQRRSPVFGKKRSPSPSPQRLSSSDEWSSRSPIRHVSPSPVRGNSPKRQRSPVQTSKGKVRRQERLSPETHQPSSPVQSGRRDNDRKASHYKSQQDSMSSPEKSQIRSKSWTSSEDRSPHKSLRQRREKLTNERSSSPPKKPRTQKPSHDIPETSDGEETYSRESRYPKTLSSPKKSKYSSQVSKQKDSSAKFHHEGEFSSVRTAGHLASEYRRYDNVEWSKQGREIKGDKTPGKGDESPAQRKSPMNKEIFSGKKPQESFVVDIKKSDDKDHSHSNYAKNGDRGHKSEATQDLAAEFDPVNHGTSYDSVSEESGKHRKERKDTRKHKRSEKKIVSSDDYSSDSELEDRREAKKKKREEKRLRKEEKRRKREERRRRREERRAEKLKMRSKSDNISDDDEAERMDHHQSDNEETPSEQWKLEIELRNKALESLKAKRGMNN